MELCWSLSFHTEVRTPCRLLFFVPLYPCWSSDPLAGPASPSSQRLGELHSWLAMAPPSQPFPCRARPCSRASLHVLCVRAPLAGASSASGQQQPTHFLLYVLCRRGLRGSLVVFLVSPEGQPCRLPRIAFLFLACLLGCSSCAGESPLLSPLIRPSSSSLRVRREHPCVSMVCAPRGSPRLALTSSSLSPPCCPAR